MSGLKIIQIIPAPKDLITMIYDDNGNKKSVPVLVLAVTDFGVVVFGYLDSNGKMAYTPKVSCA